MPLIVSTSIITELQKKLLGVSEERKKRAAAFYRTRGLDGEGDRGI